MSVENEYDAHEGEDRPDVRSVEQAAGHTYSDGDRIRYAASLFGALCLCGIAITFRLHLLALASLVLVWLVNKRGKDIYLSGFNRRRRVDRRAR